jgi:hypothetical protein
VQILDHCGKRFRNVGKDRDPGRNVLVRCGELFSKTNLVLSRWHTRIETEALPRRGRWRQCCPDPSVLQSAFTNQNVWKLIVLKTGAGPCVSSATAFTV